MRRQPNPKSFKNRLIKISSFPDVCIIFMSTLHVAVLKNHEINMQIIKPRNNQNEFENVHIASIKESFPNFVKSDL